MEGYFNPAIIFFGTIYCRVFARAYTGLLPGLKQKERHIGCKFLYAALHTKPSFLGRSALAGGLMVDGDLLFPSIICRPLDRFTTTNLAT
jgi:hypothetical protein